MEENNSAFLTRSPDEIILELESSLLTRDREKKQLHRQVAQLTALNRFAQEVTRHLTVREVMAAAHEQIQSMLSPDWVVAFLRHGDWLIHQDSGQPSYPMKVDVPQKIKVGQCLCGLSAETGQPVYSEDIRQDQRCLLKACRFSNIVSFAAIPLYTGTRIGGVLGVASREKRDFSELDTLFRTIAIHVGISLHNAELYEQIQQQADVLKEMVSRQAQMDKELESEMSFRNAIIENAAEGLCVCTEGENSSNPRFSIWNDRMAEITGYSMEEINRLGWYETIIKTSEPHVTGNDSIKRAFCGEKCRVDEMEIIRKDGQHRIVSASSSILKSNEGKPHVLTILQDTTARVSAVEALLKAKKLEAAGVLAGGIAHDFNNLLTVILGSVSLARQEAREIPQIRKLLSQAEKSCMQAKELTLKLITFSSGGVSMKQFSSIEKLLKDTIRLSLAGTSIVEEVLVADDIWEIEFDPEQLRHAIANILTNAIEASDEGGRIQVQAKNTVITSPDEVPGQSLKPGNYVNISIRDYGKGIPKENLSRAFDPYFSTKEKGVRKGMGLGLAAAYSIVKNHRGHIVMESAIGEGTSVRLFFPARRKLAVIKSVPREKEAEPGKQRILMMEDDKPLGTLSGEMLQHLGYEAVVVEMGNEALDIYRAAFEQKKPFDAVILDLTIKGGMGARETLSRLMEVDPAVCAIVSSGHTTASEITHFSSYGFKAAMIKPYTLSQLAEVLRQVLKAD